jgi:hypothetical protein
MPTSSWNMEEIIKKGKEGEDYLWKIITKATKNNWPMVAVTEPQSSY